MLKNVCYTKELRVTAGNENVANQIQANLIIMARGCVVDVKKSC